MRWYFISGPFWSCIKEIVGRRVTAPVRGGGWLGMVASLPGRGGSPLLFAFRMAPRKRKYVYWTSQPELQRDEVVKSRPT
jgi:hypothetical protein